MGKKLYMTMQPNDAFINDSKYLCFFGLCGGPIFMAPSLTRGIKDTDHTIETFFPNTKDTLFKSNGSHDGQPHDDLTIRKTDDHERYHAELFMGPAMDHDKTVYGLIILEAAQEI